LNSTQKNDKLKPVEASPPSGAKHKGHHYNLPFRLKKKHDEENGNQEKPTLEGCQSSEFKSNQLCISFLFDSNLE
jgi:hypothetical protein